LNLLLFVKLISNVWKSEFSPPHFCGWGVKDRENKIKFRNM